MSGPVFGYFFLFFETSARLLGYWQLLLITDNNHLWRYKQESLILKFMTEHLQLWSAETRYIGYIHNVHYTHKSNDSWWIFKEKKMITETFTAFWLPHQGNENSAWHFITSPSSGQVQSQFCSGIYSYGGCECIACNLLTSSLSSSL